MMYELRNWKTERLSNLPKVTQLFVVHPGFEPNSLHEPGKQMPTYLKPRQLNFQSVSVSVCKCTCKLSNFKSNWFDFNKCIWILKSKWVWSLYSPWISEACSVRSGSCLSCSNESHLAEELLQVMKWISKLHKKSQLSTQTCLVLGQN